ncbi:MAG: antitoxin MazE-like protein [Novosphingobium sp.]
MTDLSPERHDKFKAYRARKKAEGLREVRRWVPDVSSAAFREASRREAEALRNAPEEEETMQFIEALIAEDPDFFD